MSQGIQLNIQLPLEELGRFSHLLDQLQQLMAADNGRSAPQEAVKSPAFDPQRFQELMQAELAGQNEVSAGPSPSPTDRQAAPMTSLTKAPAVQAELASSQPNAPAVQAELTSIPEAPVVQSEVSFLAEAPGAESEVSFLASPPAAQAELSAVPDISAEQIQSAMEEGDIPTARPDEMPPSSEEALSDQPHASEEGDSPPPEEMPTVQEFLELSAPRSAGYYPQVQLPEASGGIWGGIQEELTFSGPAPLTAEAVSLAFQRDDRRYDNGFPLY